MGMFSNALFKSTALTNLLGSRICLAISTSRVRTKLSNTDFVRPQRGHGTNDRRSCVPFNYYSAYAIALAQLTRTNLE